MAAGCIAARALSRSACEVVLGVQRGDGVHEVLVVRRPGLRGIGGHGQVVAGEQAADVTGVSAGGAGVGGVGRHKALAPVRKPKEMGVSLADVNVSRGCLCRLGSLFTKQMVVGTASAMIKLTVESLFPATVSEGDF
jgi:hypothetical protein